MKKFSILQLEVEGNLPYWLSPEAKNSHKLASKLEEIRTRNRAKYLAKRDADRKLAADAEWDPEKHPRGQPENAGEFGPGGGRGVAKQQSSPHRSAQSSPVGHGYSSAATIKDGKIYTSNVSDATRALYEGKDVVLDQPREVSILLDHLGQVTKHLIAMGDKAPNFNLCNVSVAGSNLFCSESKGIPRVKMPQLDDEQTKKFRHYLEDKGFKIEKAEEETDHLRATQNELNGTKVAKVAQYLRDHPNEKADRIIVSRDNYILDGHHRWAAQIGLDAENNRLGDVKTRIARVDIGIIDLLKEAEKFTHGAGHKGAQDAWNESEHPRGQPENAGEFASTGGGGGGGGQSKVTPGQIKAVQAKGQQISKNVREAYKEAQSLATSKSGEGRIFASPNVKNLKFRQAKVALGGARQQQMVQAFHSVSQMLGLQSTEHPAIGAWSDGAENSAIVEIPQTSFETLEVAGAMMGALANQKAVLVFQAGTGDGAHFLASFKAKGSLNDIHEKLLESGLPFHTLEPTADGAQVYVYGSDTKTRQAANDVGKSYGSETEITYGQGKFVGSEKDGSDDEVRADAQKIYEDTIRRYTAGQSGRHNLEASWDGLRHRWAGIGKTPQDVKGRFARSHGDKNAKLHLGSWATNANTIFNHIDQVTAAAPKNQRLLQAAGAKILAAVPGIAFKAMGAKTTLKDSDGLYPKGVARVLVKAKHRGLGGVTDVARVAFIVDNPEQRDKVIAELRKYFPTIDEGYQRNQWGYYDAKALVKFPDGMIGEVQVMEKNIERAKSNKGEGAGHGHDFYAAARELPVDDPKRQELMEQSQRLYDAAVSKSDPRWNEIYGRSPMKREPA